MLGQYDNENNKMCICKETAGSKWPKGFLLTPGNNTERDGLPPFQLRQDSWKRPKLAEPSKIDKCLST